MANTNPTLTPLVATLDGQPVALDAIPTGRTLTLVVGWTADPLETFPVLNPLTPVLDDHREAMTVSWFGASGRFARERSGRSETDPVLTVENQWMAPTLSGPTRLWIVLRDSRGGVDFAEYELSIR